MDALYEFSDDSCYVSIDARQLPLLVAIWRGTPSLPVMEQYFAKHQAIIEALDAKGERCILLTRTEKAGRPPAEVRRFITTRTDELRGLLSRVIASSSIVVTNPLVRGAMTAMSWVDPDLRVPMHASVTEGYAWARQALAMHGLPASQELGAAQPA